MQHHKPPTTQSPQPHPIHITPQQTPQGLHFTITTPTTNYTGLLTTQQLYQLLAQNFESYAELISYASQPDNMQVDLEGGWLRIVGRINTKKSKEVEIAKIAIRVVVGVDCRRKLGEVLRGVDKGGYSVTDAREGIRSMALIITQILNEKQKNPQPNLQIFDRNLKQQLKHVQAQRNRKQQQLRNQIKESFNQFLQYIEAVKEEIKSSVAGQKTMQKQLDKDNVKKPGEVYVVREQFSVVKDKINEIIMAVEKMKQKLHIIEKPIQISYTDMAKKTPLPTLLPKNSTQFVDPKCFHYKHLQLSPTSNTISAVEYSYIFGQHKQKKSFRFSVKIDKMNQWISLGIIDTLYKGKQDLSGTVNRVLYTNSGDLREGKDVRKKQGRQFKEGEEVVVDYDGELGRIQWKVADDVRHVLQCPLLRDAGIKWVPFIAIQSQDVVRIFQ